MRQICVSKYPILKKKLIQQIDLRNEVTEMKPISDQTKKECSALQLSFTLTPYNVIVTPATSLVSIPLSSSSNQFSVVKSKPDKTFSINYDNAHPSPQEPFFRHKNKTHQQYSNNALPSTPALPL